MRGVDLSGDDDMLYTNDVAVGAVVNVGEMGSAHNSDPLLAR